MHGGLVSRRRDSVSPQRRRGRAFASEGLQNCGRNQSPPEAGVTSSCCARAPSRGVRRRPRAAPRNARLRSLYNVPDSNAPTERVAECEIMVSLRSYASPPSHCAHHPRVREAPRFSTSSAAPSRASTSTRSWKTRETCCAAAVPKSTAYSSASFAISDTVSLGE
jgi:hypothetical protein